MIEALEKLLGKKPSSVKVDSKITETRDQIDTLTARQSAIIDEMAADDSQVEALTQEHSAIGLRLAMLDKRLNLLAQERKEAVTREILDAYEGKVKTVVADTAALIEISPKVEAARQEYLKMEAQEQRLRNAINMGKLDMRTPAHEAARAAGINSGVINSGIEAIDAKYPTLENIVGSTRQHAELLKAIYPQKESEA